MPRPKRPLGKKVLVPVVETVAVAARSAPPPAPGPRKKSGRARGRKAGKSGPLNLYLSSMGNPFHITPPKLGYDSFGSSGGDTGWSRVYGIPTIANATCFTVICNPLVITATAGAIGAVASSHVKIVADLLPNSLLNTGAAAQYAMTDAARLQTEYDTYRTITAGLRVTVRYPMTSAPGRLFAFSPFEADTLLGPISYNSLTSLASAQPIAIDGSGVAIAEVRWRPNDVGDFLFQPATGTTPANVLNTKLIVIGLGWPSTGWSVDVETIAHHEYHSGVLASSDALDDQNVCLSTPMESLYPRVKRVAWYAGKTDVVNEDKAFRAAMVNSARLSSSRSSATVAQTSRAPDAMESSSALAEEDFKEHAGYHIISNPSDKPYGLSAGLAAATVAGVYAHRVLDRGAGQILRQMEGF